MERSALTFSGWMSDNAARLKERLSLSGIFDEDAFQDAFLAIVTATEQESTSDYESTFIKAYRQASTMRLNEGMASCHPDELFFTLLPSDGTEPMEEEEDPGDLDSLIRRIGRYIRKEFPRADVMAFEMRMKGHSLRDISETLGTGRAAVSSAINRIVEKVRLRFTSAALKDKRQ